MQKIKRRILLRRTVREVVPQTDNRPVTFVCRQCGCEQEAVSTPCDNEPGLKQVIEVRPRKKDK